MHSFDENIIWIFVKWQPTPGGSEPTIVAASAQINHVTFTAMKDLLFLPSITELPQLEMSVFLPMDLPVLGKRIIIARYRVNQSGGRSVLALLNSHHYLRKIQAHPINILRIIDDWWDASWQKVLAGNSKKLQEFSELFKELSLRLRPLPFNPLQVMESFESLKEHPRSLDVVFNAITRRKRMLFLDHGKKYDEELFIRGVLDLFPATVRQHFSSIFPAPYARELLSLTSFEWVYIFLHPEKDVQQFLTQLKQDQIHFDLSWNLNSGDVHFSDEVVASDGEQGETWYFTHVRAMLEAIRSNDVQRLEQEHQKMMKLDQIAVEYEFLVYQPPNSETWRYCFSFVNKARDFGLKDYEVKFQELTLKKSVQTSINEGIIALSRLLQDETEEQRKIELIEGFLGDVPLTRLAREDKQTRIAWYRFLLNELKNARKKKIRNLEQQLRSLIKPTLMTFPLQVRELLDYEFQLLGLLKDHGVNVEDVIRHQLFSEEVPTMVKIDLFIKSLKKSFIEIQEPLVTFEQLIRQARDSIALLDIANVFLHLYASDFQVEVIVDPIIAQVSKVAELPLHFDKIALYAKLISGRFSLKRQHLYDQLKKLVKPLASDKILRKEVEKFFNDIIWSPHSINEKKIQQLGHKLKMAYYQKSLKSKMDDGKRVHVQIEYVSAAIQARDPSLMLGCLGQVQQQDPKDLELFLDRSRKLLSLAKQFRRTGYEVPVIFDLKVYRHVLRQLQGKYRKSVSEQVLEEWIIDALEYLKTVFSRISLIVTVDATFDELFEDLLVIISKERDSLKKKTYLLYMIPTWVQLEKHELFSQYLDLFFNVTVSTEDWDYFLEWLERTKAILVQHELTSDALLQPPWSDVIEAADEEVRKKFTKLRNELKKVGSGEKLKKKLKVIKKSMLDAAGLKHKGYVFLLLWDAFDVFLFVPNEDNEDMEQVNEDIQESGKQKKEIHLHDNQK